MANRTIGHWLKKDLAAPNACVKDFNNINKVVTGTFNPDSPANEQIATSKEQFEGRYGVPFQNKGSLVGERTPDMTEITARVREDDNPCNLENHKNYTATIVEIFDLRYASRGKLPIWDLAASRVFEPKTTPPPKDPLVIPAAVAATMKEVMTWKTLGLGRLTRIKAWIDWLNSEVERRK